ncbi:Cytochrome p450, partial [Globisporangium splendens]
MVATPELFEDIMRTQFDVFEKGEEEASYMRDVFGQGILNSDGEEWYFHRKTASNLFSLQMMKDVMHEAVREKLKVFCDVLSSYESEQHPTSLKSTMIHFTSDVFGKIGFGVDLDCLQTGLLGKHHLSMIDSFIYRIVNEVAANKTAATSDTPPKNLISLFLNSEVNDVKETSFESEAHLIRDTIVNFIFAGKDTTSQSMSFFIVVMNRYPNVLAKIREELHAKLPGLMHAEGEILSREELAQLTYLEGAIRENLRLNPSVSWGSRQANADTVLSDSTPITKGARIGLAIYAAGRKTSIWDEDALEFKPERWIDASTGKLIVVSPFRFASFFAGPLQCIGMKFAMMEMKTTLAVLLSKFDLTTVENPWDITYEVAITMSVKGPLRP